MKSGMEDTGFEHLAIDEQAAHWMRVMENPTPDEETAFWCWIGTSPAHVREMVLAGKLDQELESFDRTRSIDIDALLKKAAREERAYGKHRWVMPLAASVALALSATLIAYFTMDTHERYTTKTGEQRRLDLEDGSSVVLNTRSKVKVSYTAGARDIFLSDGQALFNVRHDATRPFRVHARTAVIQAIGTQFDVRLFPDRTTVSVVEGVVQLSSPATNALPPRIGAGQAATIEANGAVDAPSRIDANAVVAWSHRQLVFKGETLERIAEEFNRYNATPRLRIEGHELRSRRFVGVFDTHDPRGLLDYLKQTPGVVFDVRKDEIVIRSEADR